jgi:hypothetical protein
LVIYLVQTLKEAIVIVIFLQIELYFDSGDGKRAISET